MRSLHSQIGWSTRLQWVLGVGLVVAVGVFYLAGYRPMNNRLETLRLQIQSKQRDLQQNQNRARNLPILAAQVRQMQGRVELYDRQFPKNPQLGEFLRDLTQISQQLSLGEWRYLHGMSKRSDGFCEMPIGMCFQGDFLNVASFLRQVEELQRKTRIKKLNLKTRNEKTGMVDVELTMNIYFSEG
jgi:Tfp pilus assembly protein PilO